MYKYHQIVVGVSGGPDSMALLDVLRIKGLKLIAAHVNYHMRKTADRDMLIVTQYCQKYGIPLVIKNVFPDQKRGNFQTWAREVRYRFFKDVIDKYHCEALYIAHQQDDLIETCMMQIERQLKLDYYGLSKSRRLYGMIVHRPFLDVPAQALKNYLKQKGIAYGIDESNLSDDYRRNQIRHTIVEKMSSERRQAFLSKVALLNQGLALKKTKVNTFLAGKSKLDLKAFLTFDEPLDVLRQLLYRDLSQKNLEELLKAIKSDNHFAIQIRNKMLVKEYGYIEVFDVPLPYHDTYQKIEYRNNKYYKITSEGSLKHGVSLKAEDFPISIRTFQNGDAIKLRYGTKKVSRFFIDHKIPTKYRKTWPIVTNSNNEVILVPGIGCNISHYSIKPNLFVVELLY